MRLIRWKISAIWWNVRLLRNLRCHEEGGIIRDGYHEEVDRLRKAKTDGKTWLAELEQKEREKTGIKNLRIKYNKVFGYYLEVTNSFKIWFRITIPESRR